MCSQKEYNTSEKHGENVELLPGGAPGGANWSEIRALIAQCEDLPEDVRGGCGRWKTSARFVLYSWPPLAPKFGTKFDIAAVGHIANILPTSLQHEILP